MDFGDTSVKFNIFEALKHPTEDHSIFNINTIDGLVEKYPSPQLDKVGQPTPSTEEEVVSPQPSNIVLKPFPEHLKYAYLGDHQQFPVIIANNLNREEEEKLLDILRRHKKEIG
ncbi:hypothetical protein CR513_21449, partial [Mucuna pruriens]